MKPWLNRTLAISISVLAQHTMQTLDSGTERFNGDGSCWGDVLCQCSAPHALMSAVNDAASANYSTITERAAELTNHQQSLVVQLSCVGEKTPPPPPLD